ncbi:class II glutamine amidotransferase [Streptacidiphilus sp. PAMC 29251]
MCRLFGLSSAPRRIQAAFWLLQAPDSLESQSRANPDGTGIGVFAEDGAPVVHRQAMAAWQDQEFALEARNLRSQTFVAHVRFASTGGLTEANTHPFEQEGRLFAHNGVVEGLDLLDARLAQLGADVPRLVHGQTDSERFFALVTAEIRRNHGDVGAGITAAAAWAADQLPLYCLNLVLTTPDGLWALRYPDTHELYVLDRAAGGPGPAEPLDHADSSRHLRARSSDLADAPCVVVASERMDQDPGWRLMRPGELVHVAPGPVLSSTIALPDPPSHQLRTGDLHPAVAASQHAR